MATSNHLRDIKDVFMKAQYMKRKWVDCPEDLYCLKKYADEIDSTFKHVSGNPIIIAKERTDGGTFLKMWIPLGADSGVEYDLSYQRDDPDYDGPIFEEGDEIDKDSLCFCIEQFLDKKHGYATGDIL